MLAFLILLCVLWVAYWTFAYLRDQDRFTPVYISAHQCADCAEGSAGSNVHARSRHASTPSGSSPSSTSASSAVADNAAAKTLIASDSPSLNRSASNASSVTPTPVTPAPVKTQSGVVPLFTAPTEAADDLKEIKGVGEVMERTLNDLGITTFKQLSEFKDAEVQMVTDALAELNAGFGDRITRDEWVKQAKQLAA